MRVFTYVIVNDAGGAPNYAPPCLTLAICKPRIRAAAMPGDLVLAFNGSTLDPNPHSVRWAGVVSEKLGFTDYWQDPRFTTKKPGACPLPDNIYEPAGLAFRQVPNPTHAPRSQRRDLSGGFVLAFGEWWHFGPPCPELPESLGLWMTGGRRGHRVTLIDDGRWAALRDWLAAQPEDTAGLAHVSAVEPMSGIRRSPRAHC